MAKGVPSSYGTPFFIWGFRRLPNYITGGTAMQPIQTHKEIKNSVKDAKPIGFRYSCGLNGSNTGLSHYILLDKKN
jgi:modified peptide precursor CbpA